MTSVRSLLNEFFKWRWSPAVVLCTASVVQAALAITLVPSEIGEPTPMPEPRSVDVALTRADPAAFPEVEGAAAEVEAPVPHARTDGIQELRVAGARRRGFSPPLPRPEPTPDPEPPSPVEVPVEPGAAAALEQIPSEPAAQPNGSAEAPPQPAPLLERVAPPAAAFRSSAFRAAATIPDQEHAGE